MITFLAWVIGVIVGVSFVAGTPGMAMPLVILIGVILPGGCAAYGAVLDAQW